MGKKLGNVEYIRVRDILVDENQPRKHFDPIRLAALKNNIMKHGIKRPLDVEEMGNGKYLIQDGERRFRTAITLGLTEVPCIVHEAMSEADRLIAQFSIQEMYESWTPIEKAMALLSLSKALSISLVETCKQLDIPKTDTARYVAFAELMDKESFVKNEVPLSWAPFYRQLSTRVKVLSREKLKTEFTKSDEKKLEHQLTKQVVKGLIQRRNDVTRIYDAFNKKPELIEKFMDYDNVSPDSLYIEAKAEGAFHLRNATSSGRNFVTHSKDFLGIRDMKLTDDQVQVFEQVKKAAQELIDLI